AGLVGQCARRHRRALRQLPCAARAAHAGCAPARARGEHRGAGAAARRPPGGARAALARTVVASGARGGGAAAGRLRRDAVAGAGGRGGRGARVPGRAPVLHAGRIAWRRRKPGRASGDHDPCRDGAGSARRGGHRRRPAAPVRRHRARGRPGRRHRRRARASGGRGDDCRGGRPMTARLALLGTGNVGSAVLGQLRRLGDRFELVHVANTRRASGDFDAAGIVIDATASEAVAERHAEWLARGVHVVTACKLGQGGPLRRWRAIRDAAARSGARYGDSATVGAGLPLLRTIRALRAGGDRIHGLAGVLSGSLAWLFDAYDGTRPFAECVRQAQAAGYTEPDPRDDLSGEDVRRKLLILARAAGFELESGAVRVESLADAYDEALRDRLSAARASGGRLAFVARLQ